MYDNSLKIVYDKLVKETRYEDSYDKFVRVMGKPENRRLVYDVLKEQTGYGESYEDFESKIMTGTRAATRQAAMAPYAGLDCVYVCSGPSAKRYHLVKDCKGLSKCYGYILEMTVDEAQARGKTPCKMCFKQ